MWVLVTQPGSSPRTESSFNHSNISPTTIFFPTREIMLACCYRAGSSNLLRVTQKSYECSPTQNHKLIWNITELFLVTWLCGSWERVLKMTISRHNIMQNKPMCALNVSMRVCLQFYRGLWLPIVLFSKHRFSHRHCQTLHVLMVTWGSETWPLSMQS